MMEASVDEAVSESVAPPLTFLATALSLLLADAFRHHWSNRLGFEIGNGQKHQLYAKPRVL
jgi:hypothetical protein